MMVSYTEENGKSSPMKALPQPQTTSSGLRGNRSRYTLDSPPPAAHISYKPEMTRSPAALGDFEARLKFMIYEMPDDITVLPYRDTSYTTVDTAAPLVH